jgi:hypothetical protein
MPVLSLLPLVRGVIPTAEEKQGKYDVMSEVSERTRVMLHGMVCILMYVYIQFCIILVFRIHSYIVGKPVNYTMCVCCMYVCACVLMCVCVCVCVCMRAHACVCGWVGVCASFFF